MLNKHINFDTWIEFHSSFEICAQKRCNSQHVFKQSLKQQQHNTVG